ncbi:hypothetical protein TESG_02435 [Trichophyton tonsurans CBS 112818]|uniref:Uncharacterized protein n=2 Tax=Trichophyton TaxID=5550 RepID=F2PKT2_TRIEC|nr:hypothetical protein TESG_02435 [Trichophyton tonsurans CBS 112818]EGE02500.1 hypothetical protein TEQG_01535 [Trichophyton equinum CBS 127.97]
MKGKIPRRELKRRFSRLLQSFFLGPAVSSSWDFWSGRKFHGGGFSARKETGFSRELRVAARYIYPAVCLAGPPLPNHINLQYLSSSFPSFANRGLKNRRSEVGADPGKRFCSKGNGRIDTSC